MYREGERGSVTVFLSLVCILFLSLICTAAESARIQGAKTQTANLTGLGNFSLLAEFENHLLEKYEILGLDASYGGGTFRIYKTGERLEELLCSNANPTEGILSVLCFDPWNLELIHSEISEYALLTDQEGEAFYQQAVSFMKENLGTGAVKALLEYAKETDEIEKNQDTYEKEQKENDDRLSDLEEQKEQRARELESEQAEGENGAKPPETEKKNPLLEIAKLRMRSTLSIVTGGKPISQNTVTLTQLPSRQITKKGSLKLEKVHQGVTADVLFREYLLQHFPNYLSEEKGKGLVYQLEYLIGGTALDRQNLKAVVNRLLLLREGMNYLYCAGNRQMNGSAQSLAAALTGFLGIPALTAATKHALLLAWAYGESLIDVRTLLEGDKVPLRKDAASWTLTLENLGRIVEILDQGGSGQEKGLEYRDYLRILLYMGSRSKQKRRALDLIELNLREMEGSETFRAENCIVGIKTRTEWKIKPVFFSLAQAVNGLKGEEITVVQTGGLSYLDSG